MAVKKVKLPNNITLDINDARDVIIGDGVENVVTLTSAEYEALSTKDPDTLYIITDATGGGGEENVIESITFNGSTVPVTNKTAAIIGQAVLVSGTNIKTINNQSILGSGNITIQGGGGLVEEILDTSNLVPNTYIKKEDGTEAAYAGWSSTGFIDISDGIQIKADRALAYSAFYSSNATSSYISAANISTSYLAIPSNAQYIRLSGSSSDMSAATVTLLATGGSSGGGEENVIEIVKVNGSALTPDANKAVDIPIPTISTNISSDAASDTKTASPKAVKTYVDGIVGDIETLLAAI